ncbi:MAG: (Fe-S)-binding protein [Planctomycetes bacterium]|nr:(Fe-S)-binding protein [Planctomycetota bacterium]
MSDPRAGREVCAYCPKLCRHACPAAEAERSEEATPTHKQQLALKVAEGAPLDAERARLFFKCSDCGAATAACRHRVPVAASLRLAKADAVERGLAPAEVAWLAERFAETGSPYALSLRDRAAEVLGAPASDGARGYFAGCTALVHDPDEARAGQELLGLCGGSQVAAPSQGCCGYPLDALGHSGAFLAQARSMAVALSGFSELVVAGPACAWTFARRYAEVGVPFPAKVRTLPVALSDALDTIRGRSRRDAPPLAYHDPCFLARRLGVVREPRALLRACTGRAPLELGYAREHTRCSGGGGGYPLTHPEPARSCAGKLAELVDETEAQVLVTACSSTRRQLARARPELRTVGLASFVREQLRPGASPQSSPRSGELAG